MGKADTLVANMLITHSVNLLRFSSGMRARVLSILQAMELELTAQLVAGSLSDFKRDRADRLLRETSAVIGRYYDDIQGKTNYDLKGMAKVSAAAARQALKKAYVTLDIAMPTAHMLDVLVDDTLIQGAQAKEFWQAQSSYTFTRYRNELRMGITQGETKAEIIARLIGREAKGGAPAKAGILDMPKKEVSRLVHSSVMTVANAARRRTYDMNPETCVGLKQLSTLDGRTTDICLAYSGATFAAVHDADGTTHYEPTGDTTLPFKGGCPRHWGCRSVETPLLKTFAERGIDIPEFPSAGRASNRGTLAGDITMDDYLAGKTEAELNEQLGKGRADLYRRGVITLQQLLDQNGNPLTLAQLQAIYL